MLEENTFHFTVDPDRLSSLLYLVGCTTKRVFSKNHDEGFGFFLSAFKAEMAPTEPKSTLAWP